MNIPKPDARELVLLGAGPSLDRVMLRDVVQDRDRIVISINGGALFDSDYFCATDVIALRTWATRKFLRESTPIIVPNFRAADARREAPSGNPVIPVESLLSVRIAGASSVGWALAIYLARRLPNLETIRYVGIDYARAEDANGTWNYAGLLRPHYPATQAAMCRPDSLAPILRVHRIPPEPKRPGMDAVAYCYGVQHVAVHKIFASFWRPQDRAKLVSASLTDVRVLVSKRIVTDELFQSALTGLA